MHSNYCHIPGICPSPGNTNMIDDICVAMSDEDVKRLPDLMVSELFACLCFPEPHACSNTVFCVVHLYQARAHVRLLSHRRSMNS